MIASMSEADSSPPTAATAAAAAVAAAAAQRASSPSRQLSWACVAAAAAAAVLLWGVGAEAACFGHRLSGAFLLADAVIVSVLEAMTVADLLRWSPVDAHACRTASAAVDTYRRAAVYALLTVPCFVRLHLYWLPAVPGCALIVSVILYAMKHCSCKRRLMPYNFGKMPTFVRFEDEGFLSPEVHHQGQFLSSTISASADVGLSRQQQQQRQDSSCDDDDDDNIEEADSCHQRRHQKTACSGSRDSGIEANHHHHHQAAGAAALLGDATAEGPLPPPPPPRRISKAFASTSPGQSPKRFRRAADKRCLLLVNDDA